MDKQRKKELLKLVKQLEDKLKHYEGRSFVSFLANSSKTYYLQQRPAEEYMELLFFRKAQAKQILGSGNAGAEGYKKFIEEELRLTKAVNKVIIGNHEFAKMNIEEIAYVFGWLRRVTVEDDDKKSKGQDWIGSRRNNTRNNEHQGWKVNNNRQSYSKKENAKSCLNNERKRVHSSNDDTADSNVFKEFFNKG